MKSKFSIVTLVGLLALAIIPMFQAGAAPVVKPPKELLASTARLAELNAMPSEARAKLLGQSIPKGLRAAWDNHVHPWPMCPQTGPCYTCIGLGYGPSDTCIWINVGSPSQPQYAAYCQHQVP